MLFLHLQQQLQQQEISSPSQLSRHGPAFTSSLWLPQRYKDLLTLLLTMPMRGVAQGRLDT